jgi:hypothetical protein
MPSTVGTTTSRWATIYSFQRKTFFANGRFWVFYTNGEDMVYRTSTDGVAWSSETIVVSGLYDGRGFSIWFDGTYLHYAYAYGEIYYRRGTPNSDGTITWGDEQVVSTTYNSTACPMISVDSYGYVWIGYKDWSGSNYYPYVIKSGSNDGTWGTTPDGFPHQLSATPNSEWCVSVVPLLDGKMVAFYAFDDSTIKAKPWDGSAWGVEEETTSKIRLGFEHSAVAEYRRNFVHLAFLSLRDSVYDIVYVKYEFPTESGGFGTETTLQANVNEDVSPAISIVRVTDMPDIPAPLGYSDLYVFWIGSPTTAHIYYRKYNLWTETWEPVVDLIDESIEGTLYRYLVTSFYEARGNQLGLVYLTKTSSPYNVRFAYLTIMHKQAQEMMRSGL